MAAAVGRHQDIEHGTISLGPAGSPACTFRAAQAKDLACLLQAPVLQAPEHSCCCVHSSSGLKQNLPEGILWAAHLRHGTLQTARAGGRVSVFLMDEVGFPRSSSNTVMLSCNHDCALQWLVPPLMLFLLKTPAHFSS